MDLQAYRQSEPEQARTADLLRILPRGRTSVLDVGARDWYHARLLTGYYGWVVALDLTPAPSEMRGVSGIVADALRLPFKDWSFDCVFCAEVLEHLKDVKRACAEIARVSRYDVVVGVPYLQDLRLGRTTCRTCGGVNPPWGHVNTFDEHRLALLFPGWTAACTSLVWETREATTGLAAALMTAAGHPWGTYDQEQPCLHCGAKLVPPETPAPVWSRICSRLPSDINRIQERLTKPRARWLHVVFSRPFGQA
jgi:SAM-dependent methyltransferase